MKYIVINLLLILIAACGGSGSSPSTNSNPPPGNTNPSELANEIDGRWVIIDPEEQCNELLELRSSGAAELHSSQQVSKGVYTFDNQVNDEERYRLEIEFLSDNGKPDCTGDSEGFGGYILELYVEFLNDTTLVLYQRLDSVDPLGFLTIDDEIKLANAPNQMQAGQTYEIDLKTVYRDPTLLSIVYGPENLKLEQGKLIYTPSRSLFSDSQIVRGAIKSFAGYEPLEFAFEILSAGGAAPYVIGKSEIPIRQSRLHVGNFDTVPGDEILTLTGNNRLALSSIVQGQLRQTQIYPYGFDYENYPSHVYTVDMNGDGKQEIYVTGATGIYLVTDFSKAPKKIIDFEADVHAFIVADVDEDGNADLVTIEASRIGNSRATELVVRKTNSGENVWSLEIEENDTSLNVGQFDQDSQLEIVLASGTIIDGVTGRVESQLNSISTHEMTIGDINGDGIDEVADRNSIYDPFSQTTLLQFDTSNYYPCEVFFVQIDTDPELEILHRSCEGELLGFEFSEGNLIPVFTYAGEAESVIAVKSGDFDANSDPDLVYLTWGGFSMSVLSDFNNPRLISLSKSDNSITGIVPAGFASVQPGMVKPIIAASVASNETDKIARVGYFEKSGEIKLSEPFFETVNSRAFLNVKALDAHGTGFSKVSVTGNSGEWVQAELDSGIIERTASQEYHIQKLYDFDGDGALEIVVNNGSKMEVLDLQTGESQVVFGLSREIFDFVLWSAGEQVKMAVTTLDNLYLYEVAPEVKLVQSIRTPWCVRVEYVKSLDRILCISERYGNATHLLDTYDLALNRQSEVRLDYKVTDLLVLDDSKNVILATSYQVGEVTDELESRIQSVDVKSAELIWKSDPLIAPIEAFSLMHQIDPNGNIPVLMFSTGKEVYVTQ